jgi:cytochrome P450
MGILSTILLGAIFVASLLYIAPNLIPRAFRPSANASKLSKIPKSDIHPIKRLYSLLVGSRTPINVEFRESRRDILFGEKSQARGLIQMQYGVFIADPEVAKQFLMDLESFPKFMPWANGRDSMMGRLFGQSNIVMSNIGGVDDDYKRHRRAMNPAFKRGWDTSTFGSIAVHAVEKLMKSSSFDCHKMMQAITLDAIGLYAFNYDFESVANPDSELVQVYSRVIESLVRAPIRMMLPVSIPLPSMRSLAKDLAHIDKLMMDIINKRKDESVTQGKNESVRQGKDVLDMMLESTEEGGLTTRELRDNTFVLFIAGNDTTANALCAVLYHLAKYPEVQERCRREVLKLLPIESEAMPRSKYPTFQEQGDGLPYLTAVIKESLRLFPPTIAVNPRITNKDVTLHNGIVLPKGTLVNLDIYSLHRNPDYWAEPEKFDPERFMDNKDKEQHAFAWIPFSSGTRQCLGMQFSYVEQRVTLCVLLRNFCFSLPKDSIHQDGYKLQAGELVSPQKLILNIIPLES